MRPTCSALLLAILALAVLSACSPRSGAGATGPAVARLPDGFPAPDRPVARVGSPDWASPPERDAADESGQLIRGLEIQPGMAVADIGAGSGYHTLRLSPAVGPTGVVYAEDIVEQYLSGLRREAARRGLKNIRIVVGKADDPALPPHSVDRAVLVHMYHEIASPYALLWRLAPALRSGGRVGVIDLDRAPQDHGTPPALLKCEFEAVGYREVAFQRLGGGVGYLAVFTPPGAAARPAPQAIRPCDAPDQ